MTKYNERDELSKEEMRSIKGASSEKKAMWRCYTKDGQWDGVYRNEASKTEAEARGMRCELEMVEIRKKEETIC